MLLSVRTFNIFSCRNQISHPNCIAIYTSSRFISFYRTTTIIILIMILQITFDDIMLNTEHPPIDCMRRIDIPFFVHKLLVIQDDLSAALVSLFIAGADLPRKLRWACKCRNRLRQHHKRGKSCHCRFSKTSHLSNLHNQIHPFYNKSFVFLFAAIQGLAP